MNKLMAMSMIALVSITASSCHGVGSNSENGSAQYAVENVLLQKEIHDASMKGLTRSEMQEALNGNADQALKNAIHFADRAKFDEAIFWYQVSAENGNSIAMQHLSVFLRNIDCVRANYFLGKYLESLDQAKKMNEYSEVKRELDVHVGECEKHPVAAN